MNKETYMVLMVLAMAFITYLIRALPMLIFKKKIKSRFINSLLYYLPYAVLSAMTFPFIFYCSSNFLASAIGAGVALIGAFFRRSLVTVALLACLAVLAVQVITALI